VVKTFINWLLAIILTAIIFAGIGGLVLWQTKGVSLYSVQTNSMAPSLKKGALVIDTKARADSINNGDVISYFSSNGNHFVVTHRVVRVERNFGVIITKGDNLSQVDPPVLLSSVIGKTATAIPKAGYAYNIIRTPLGLVGLVYIPAILILTFEIRRLIRHFGRRTYRLAHRI